MKRLLTLLAAVFMFCGCGESTGKVDSATKQELSSAIAKYCSGKSMGMKVKSFENVDIQGNNATALCKMEEAGGLYNMSVKWSFKFKKQNGKWVATEHSDKK